LPELIWGNWKPRLEKYKQLLDGFDNGLSIHNAFYGIDHVGLDPEIFRLTKMRYDDIFKIAQEFRWHQVGRWLSRREKEARSSIHNVHDPSDKFADRYVYGGHGWITHYQLAYRSPSRDSVEVSAKKQIRETGAIWRRKAGVHHNHAHFYDF
jgi:hypothetical protein